MADSHSYRYRIHQTNKGSWFVRGSATDKLTAFEYNLWCMLGTPNLLETKGFSTEYLRRCIRSLRYWIFFNSRGSNLLNVSHEYASVFFSCSKFTKLLFSLQRSNLQLDSLNILVNLLFSLLDQNFMVPNLLNYLNSLESDLFGFIWFIQVRKSAFEYSQVLLIRRCHAISIKPRWVVHSKTVPKLTAESNTNKNMAFERIWNSRFWWTY